MLSLLFTCTVWFGGSVVCLISATVLLLTATQTERQRGGSLSSAWDLSFPICSITPLLRPSSVFLYFHFSLHLLYLDLPLYFPSIFGLTLVCKQFFQHCQCHWLLINVTQYSILMDVAVWCVCHYCCFCVRCWCYCCCYCCVVYTDPSHKWPLLCCLYCCPYLWQLACAACATAGPKWRDMTMAARLPVLPKKTEEATFGGLEEMLVPEEDTWRTWWLCFYQQCQRRLGGYLEHLTML